MDDGDINNFVFHPQLCFHFLRMLCNFSASAMFVKSLNDVRNALSLTSVPGYLASKESTGGMVMDFRDLQIPLGRKFSALKLWLVFRIFGVLRLR